MSEQDIYAELIGWLKKAGTGLADTEELTALINATDTSDEAYLAAGMPFSGKNLKELAEIKKIEPAKMMAKWDAMAENLVTDQFANGNGIA